MSEEKKKKTTSRAKKPLITDEVIVAKKATRKPKSVLGDIDVGTLEISGKKAKTPRKKTAAIKKSTTSEDEEYSQTLEEMGEKVNNLLELLRANMPEDETGDMELDISDNEPQESDKILKNIPIIPLRDTVAFPNAISPLFIGREKSIAAVEHVMKEKDLNRKVFLTMQKNAENDDPSISEIFTLGVVGNIMQCVKLPDDTLKVLVDASYRARIIEDHSTGKKVVQALDNGKFLEANIEILTPETTSNENPMSRTTSNVKNAETAALMRSIQTVLDEYVAHGKKISADMSSSLKKMIDPGTFADLIASYLPLTSHVKQEVLQIIDVTARLEKVFTLISEEVDILKAEKTVEERVKSQMNKNQRDYYLNERLKAIRQELGEADSNIAAVEQYEELLKKKKLPPEAHTKAKEEIKRLNTTSPISAENIRTYLDWMFALPWSEYSNFNTTIDFSRQILEKHHYGLDKVKENILEYIAVQIHKKHTKSAILCLYGPPGVGKTTLVRSIAEAMGRKYVKIALGGVRDEAEIRGHRRTYIGAMPGKIIQGMKRAETCDPVILLDEIDKMSNDYRGNPESALLEALDPEQNKEFNDHYLEVNYDLSKVMFICTANSLNMQRPLLDRLEIIDVPSYLDKEKMQICKQHIIAKQFESTGITPSQLQISDSAIQDIIHYYTREAGVRELERLIGKITRKALVGLLDKPIEVIGQVVTAEKSTEEIVKPAQDVPNKGLNIDPNKSIEIDSNNLEKFLGVKKYLYNATEQKDLIGVTNGLAYTSVGGDILHIEAVKIPGGKGEVKITGKLGEVMRESAQASLSYIKSRCYDFGIKASELYTHDIHIHVPEGATPKDGPSAGVTLCTTIVSLFTNIPVRHDVAMTGEITLRGRVLPIGGLREKLTSAIRSGIKIALIPQENSKDIDELPESVKNGLTIITCANVDEVLKIALSREPEPIPLENRNDLCAKPILPLSAGIS